MATRDRIEHNNEGMLSIKVTPEEYMALAERSGEELYYMCHDDIEPGFSFEGVYIYCREVRELRELQKARAISALDSVLCKTTN